MSKFGREKIEESKRLTIRQFVDLVLQQGGNLPSALELLKKMNCGRPCPKSRKNPAGWQTVSLIHMTESDLSRLLICQDGQGVRIGRFLKGVFGQWVFPDDLVYQRIIDRSFGRGRWYWPF